MEDDVAKALAYQVKRELAERYFGLRKLIEEDSANYFRKIEEIKEKYLPRIKEAWFRIYFLLGDRELAKAFCGLLSLKEPPFYAEFEKLKDPLALLKGLSVKGFTNKGRYKNLFLAAYEKFQKEIEAYRKAFTKAKVEAEVINHEIELFKEKYDLNEIMQFLKSLEAPSALADLGHTSLEESVTTLEKSLAFEIVPPPEKFLPPPPPKLPPLKEIKKDLEKLALLAYRRQAEQAKEIIRYVKTRS